jgi:hypothetical protein
MRYPLLLGFVVLAAPGGGCGEDMVQIHGAVSVDPAVARNFTVAAPGRVLVDVHLKTGGGFQSAGIVCGDTGALRFPFVFAKIGCASPGTVTAWVQPVAAEAAASVKCGPHDERWPAPAPADTKYQSTVMVFKGDPGCGDHTERDVEIAIRP